MIVYELNEVPKKLFEFYAEAFPNSAFAKLLTRSRLFETVTADVGSLSPWVTWPTRSRCVPSLPLELECRPYFAALPIDAPSDFHSWLILRLRQGARAGRQEREEGEEGTKHDQQGEEGLTARLLQEARCPSASVSAYCLCLCLCPS